MFSALGTWCLCYPLKGKPCALLWPGGSILILPTVLRHFLGYSFPLSLWTHSLILYGNDPPFIFSLNFPPPCFLSVEDRLISLLPSHLGILAMLCSLSLSLSISFGFWLSFLWILAWFRLKALVNFPILNSDTENLLNTYQHSQVWENSNKLYYILYSRILLHCDTILERVNPGLSPVFGKK